MERTKEQKLDQFIKNEVLCQVNVFVQFSLAEASKGNQEAPVSLEDFENWGRLPEYFGKYARFEGGQPKDIEEEQNRLEGLKSAKPGDDPTPKDIEIEEEQDALLGLEYEPQEIFEYWIVSAHLAEDLKRKGEPVAEYDGPGAIWGRTTTGQAISIDAVIDQIFNELGK